MASSSSPVYGEGLPVYHSLNESLHDNIGKPPVWRCRVRIIVHRQAKMPARVLAVTLDNIFAAADQFNYRKRQVWEMMGSAARRFARNAARAG